VSEAETAQPSIQQILWTNGYGHRPVLGSFGSEGLHEIFSLNTMEVVATSRAHTALAAVGIEA
jgi:hypothetical protein